MTYSSESHTSVRVRSTILRADLMLLAMPFSTRSFITKGLNSSSAISLGRPHWYIFSSGPTTMTRTAGIVHALAQQVLAEAALLALQHVRKALQRAVVGARHRAAAAAVVDQGVHGLLQHALFVAHNDVGRAQLQQAL